MPMRQAELIYWKYLWKEIRHQLIVTADWLAFYAERLLGFGKADEFNGNDSTLVQELEETVLAIRSRLTKIHHSCLVVVEHNRHYEAYFEWPWNVWERKIAM